MSASDRIAGWLADRAGGRASLDRAFRECLRMGGIGAREMGALRGPLLDALREDGRFLLDGDGTISLVAEARVAWDAVTLVPLREATFTVVDIETSGSRAGTSGIVEIGAVRLRAGVILDEFHVLTNPGEPIPRFIQRMTGISDAMVAGAPPFLEAIPGFLSFLGPTVCAAHNAPFDFGFLRAAVDRTGAPPIQNAILCTVRLTRKLLPRLRQRNLDAVASHLGIRIEGRHRALGDARATARVLDRLTALAAERGARTPSDLLPLGGIRKQDRARRS